METFVNFSLGDSLDNIKQFTEVYSGTKVPVFNDTETLEVESWDLGTCLLEDVRYFPLGVSRYYVFVGTLHLTPDKNLTDSHHDEDFHRVYVSASGVVYSFHGLTGKAHRLASTVREFLTQPYNRTRSPRTW